jgi:hypothetical protein
VFRVASCEWAVLDLQLSHQKIAMPIRLAENFQKITFQPSTFNLELDT